MGQDFISRTQETLLRSWDRSMERFDGSDLFSPVVSWDERTVLFEVLDGASAREGEQLTVRLDGTTLLALRVHDRIAVSSNAPSWAVELVTRCYGVADGRVVRINALSGTVDISLGAHL